jgi:hypothetical protein
MSKTLGAIMLVLALASCSGGGSGKAPRELDNACSILQQRPGYLSAFRAAERKWGVPVHVQMATIYQESKFISNARTPFRYAAGIIPMGRQSSAYGYSQALDGTWKEYQRDQRKFSAKRDRIRDATDFMGWYMTTTQKRNGIPLTDARNQYLAYHEGHTGYARGNYNKKPWLVRVSGEVGARSNIYRQQISSCNVRR